MKARLYTAFIISILLLFTMAPGISAQDLTGDLAILKAGYQRNIYEYDIEMSEPLEYNGVALQAEYNLNLGMILLGFGVEWSRVANQDDRDTVFSFATPSASLKLLMPGGLYIGTGGAGKYLLDQNIPGGDDFERELDFWAQGIAGFYFPLTEMVVFNAEGRFGWNVTKNQFSENIDVLTQYDITLYAGIGMRMRTTGI
ncbi:MAG: hypothetical protein ACOCWZ_08715 [Spirochaetota bacterium]